MATLEQIVDYSNDLLQAHLYRDASLNGLQVETNLERKITKIAASVDAGEAVIKQACDKGVQLLIVHHGLFWAESATITGALKRKIKLLLDNNCALYASHLPLDGHRTLGNGAQLAQLLQLKKITPFCEYKGSFVGASGEFAQAKNIQQIRDTLSGLSGATTPLVLNFGKKQISRVGIVTGSGSFALKDAADQGLDLLISGEPKQDCYHLTQELKMNAIFCGHYATETFGVKALAEKLAKHFQLKSQFIEWPTGI